MSRPERLKEKHGKSNKLSMDKCAEESAARTRPFSLEEIMFRRKKKELLENVKDSVKEARNISPGDSSEKIADHFESGRIYKHDNNLSSVIETHDLEELEKVCSRKKVESTHRKEFNQSGGKEREGYYSGTKLSSGLSSNLSSVIETHDLEELEKVCSRKKVESTHRKEFNQSEGKEREGYYSGTKLSSGLSSMGRINKGSRTDKEMLNWRKNDGRVAGNSEYEPENKCTNDSTNRDRNVEVDRQKSERKKKNYHAVDDEKHGEYKTKGKHDKDIYNRGKREKWSSDDSEKVVENEHHVDSASKNRHADSRGKYEGEHRRKYRNEADYKIQDRNGARKQDVGQHGDPKNYKRKERQERVKSHVEESRPKRRWSRSREREERRRKSPSLSPRARKRTHYDEDRTENSVKNGSRKSHSDVERSRVATNGSSSHRHRYVSPTSGLGGYSPRKRKTEAAVKTPSPSKHSLEKKRAGWDLPPLGTDNSLAVQSSNVTTLSALHDVAPATSVDPIAVNPLSVPLLNDSSTRKNVDIDSVQLTQATRPLRRLYLENLPASASERAVMQSLNNLLLTAGVNHIQGVQPCISCILHKDKGQALVEFLTAEDASTALSFDGSPLCGFNMKIRRPKDYVEVATGELERSVDAAVSNTISDVVIDSPDKIFVGGISKHLSSDMLMEIASAFGSLKAFHFGPEYTGGHCAFLEYVDHSNTLKACMGLNGMKLGGEVLTVALATPNASSLENVGKPPSYEIPEHAMPLLSKPTQVLKIKNVFTMEALSSMPDVEIEEILEDVRLECARFGTIKSINVVKHSRDGNEATKSEEREIIKHVGSDGGASQNCVSGNINAESSFSDKSTNPESTATSRVVFPNGNNESQDKSDGTGNIVIDNLGDNSCQGEQVVIDTTVQDIGNMNIPNVIMHECPDHHNTNKDESILLDNMVADKISSDEIENAAVAVDTDLNHAALNFQEGVTKLDASLGTELTGGDMGNSEKDSCGHILEPASVLVEYGRSEACCDAAHYLHGRFFDGRIVSVEYVALSSYKARFTK